MSSGTENVIKKQRYEDNNLNYITYRQWMTTDRSILETSLLSCSDFFESFVLVLHILFVTSSYDDSNHISISIFI